MLGVRHEKEGKLRVTYAHWDDAKVVLDGQVFRRNGAIDPPPSEQPPPSKNRRGCAPLWDHPMPQKRAESSPLFKTESVILGIRHEHRREAVSRLEACPRARSGGGCDSPGDGRGSVAVPRTSYKTSLPGPSPKAVMAG